MAKFRQISDEVYGEAGAILRYVHKGGTPPEVEVLPEFERIVAASALALEKAAPNLLYSSHETEAERWVQEGTNEWRMMHQATARAIDMHRSREAQFDEPNDVMTYILADVATQAQARKLDLAIRLGKPFEEGLTESQVNTVEYARGDKDVTMDIRNETAGRYELLDSYAQRDIASDLVAGTYLSKELKAEISASYSIIDQAMRDRGSDARYIDERIADLNDFQRPLFNEIDPANVARVDFLSRGEVRTPSSQEAGVMAHERLFPTEGKIPFETLVARARVLGDMDDRYETPSAVAIAIEADRHAISKARGTFSIDDGTQTQRDEVVGHGDEHHRLPKDLQAELFREIRTGVDLPMLTAVRLARAAEEISEEGRTLDMVKARPDRAFDRSITYEGIDISEDGGMAENFPSLRGLKLPGDEVRIDHARQVKGHPSSELEEKLGSDVLIVSKTIVTGTQEDNGIGGSYLAMRPELEFVGHEGRHPAGAFMDHRGEEHAYGMLAVEGGKLWMLPFNGDIDPNVASEVVGAPREVVGFLEGETPREREDNFLILKHEMEQEPSSGEFYFRPQSFGDKAGPVELITSPWMSGAWSGEVEMGMPIIRNAVDNPLHWSLEQGSAEWRSENGTPSMFARNEENRMARVEFDEKGVDASRAGFRQEVEHMLNGSLDKSNEVRAAAAIAARGRPLDAEAEAKALIGISSGERMMQMRSLSERSM